MPVRVTEDLGLLCNATIAIFAGDCVDSKCRSRAGSYKDSRKDLHCSATNNAWFEFLDTTRAASDNQARHAVRSGIPTRGVTAWSLLGRMLTQRRYQIRPLVHP